jgi:hypothetical protein
MNNWSCSACCSRRRLDDLALLPQLISEDVGMKLEKADPSMLGRAKKV